MTHPDVRRPGSRGPDRPGPARRAATRSWILLAVGAVAAAIVIVAITPVGRTYGEFVASAFGRTAPTCQDPGDLTAVAPGDLEADTSADGRVTTFRFSGGDGADGPDIRMVCVVNVRAERLTLTTTSGSRSTRLPRATAPRVPTRLEVAPGRTMTATMRMTALRDDATAKGALTSVVFYSR